MRCLFVFLALAGCWSDETISSFVDKDMTWVVLEGPSAGTATIEFPAPGDITGAGPCNRYFAKQSAPYPWFDIGPIGATKRACPALAQEHAFFAALEAATLVEVSGPVLVLSNDTGPVLTFSQRPPAQSDR